MIINSEAAKMHIALSEDSILHSYSCTGNTIPSLYSTHFNGLSFNCNFFFFFFLNRSSFLLCGNLPVELLNPEHFCGTIARDSIETF